MEYPGGEGGWYGMWRGWGVVVVGVGVWLVRDAGGGFLVLVVLVVRMVV